MPVHIPPALHQKPSGWRKQLKAYFEFEELGTTWRTEISAGLTTFVTMAYIVLVNPAILHDAGMPYAGVVYATCVAGAYGSFAMGVFARCPIALAPGMGLNAYFAYTVVKGFGVPWQTALGAVFVSGVAFLLLTVFGVRRLILATIPKELYAAVSAGVGVFIAYIGLRNARLLVLHAATVLTIGNIRHPGVALACFGLIVISVLLARRVRAAILIGILLTTVVAERASGPDRRGGSRRIRTHALRSDISGAWDCAHGRRDRLLGAVTYDGADCLLPIQ